MDPSHCSTRASLSGRKAHIGKLMELSYVDEKGNVRMHFLDLLTSSAVTRSSGGNGADLGGET